MSSNLFSDDFNYLGSLIASTEHGVNNRLGKAWTALNGMNNIWKSNLPDHLKRNFFRATVESVLVYGSVSWTLTSTLEKRIDGAFTRMLRTALNKSWTDHLTNAELYGCIPHVSSTIREQRLRFAGHCWRSKNEICSEVLLWEPLQGKRSRGRPRKTYIDQLTADTGYNKEDLPNAMADRYGWRQCVIRSRAEVRYIYSMNRSNKI